MIRPTAFVSRKYTSAGESAGASSSTTDSSSKTAATSSSTPSIPERPPIPIDHIANLCKNWKVEQLPTGKCPKWIENLANELVEMKTEAVEGPKWAEPRIAKIQEEFNSRKLTDTSCIVYLSHLKVKLINNGFLMNPKYWEELAQEEECPQEALEPLLSLPHNYSIFRTHMASYRTLRLKTRVLRQDIRIGARLLHKNMRHKVLRLQTKRLLERPPITITHPQALLHWVSTALEDCLDPGRLVPALLLACGRRPLALFTCIETSWSIGDISPMDRWIYHTEWVKKRGRSYTKRLPLLIPCSTFYSALQKLHSTVLEGESCHPDEFQTKWGAKCREWCSAVPFCDGVTKPCDLRPIYAAFMAHENRVTVNQVKAIKDCLSHSRPSTVLNYLRVNLDWAGEMKKERPGCS